jgi:hypothetical protein
LWCLGRVLPDGGDGRSLKGDPGWISLYFLRLVTAERDGYFGVRKGLYGRVVVVFT